MQTKPVLFLVFNRPGPTQQVFDVIRQARPLKLFIAADGPRPDRSDDIENCRRVREIIEQVDWECEVKTLLRDQNLGCKQAVSSAITWFFDQVEEGIILEDDCLPDLSFFEFCQQMLARYHDDERVMMVNGTNYLIEAPLEESYFFSRYFAIWGWATWKRAWQLYDIKMQDWPRLKEQKYLDGLVTDWRARLHYRASFERAYMGRVDTWDTQWTYTCLFNHGLAVTPRVNLITNIGHTGTHTGARPVVEYGRGGFVNMPRQKLDTDQLKHPVHVAPQITCDRAINRVVFSKVMNLQQLLKIWLKRIWSKANIESLATPGVDQKQL